MPTYERKNFAQAEPNTPIHVGQAGNVYRRCNLTNCRVPDDATVEKCQRSQRLRWTETVEVDVEGPTTGSPPSGEMLSVEQPMTAWVGRGVKGEVTDAAVAAKAVEEGVSDG